MCLAVTGASCYALGTSTGFLCPDRPVRDLRTILVGTAAALVSPALVEEMVFRAAMLPHPAVDAPAAHMGAATAAAWLQSARTGAVSAGSPGWVSIPGSILALLRSTLPPLALFVVYHLCNPRPKSRLVFRDERFLTLAAMLGAGGTAAFIVTGGSLVAAVEVHWSVWLFLLGGYQILGYHKECKAAD